MAVEAILPLLDAIGTLGFPVAAAIGVRNYRDTDIERTFRPTARGRRVPATDCPTNSNRRAGRQYRSPSSTSDSSAATGSPVGTNSPPMYPS